MRNLAAMAGAIAMMAQACLTLAWGPHAGQAPFVVMASAGAGIFGAAFFLSWAAEAAQIDIPASLSFAFLAFIAVLPEYAVDIYFAWQGGKDPVYTQYATANMTGANRILIGVGWPLVMAAYALRSRQATIELDQSQRTELRFLLLATLYCFLIPIKGTLGLFDSVVLVGIFIAYLKSAASGDLIEPELAGPAETIGGLPEARRRLTVAVMFAVAAMTIVWAAEPFAESLLGVGRRLDIEEFVLIQWLAPLASEAPEFIIAVLFALRLKPASGFATLLSSKVNQWTLLIGALPMAYALSAGTGEAIPLGARQSSEILLTGAQSLFAVVLLAPMKFSRLSALALALLFTAQLVMPSADVRTAFVWIYLGIAAAIVATSSRHRRALGALLTNKS